MRERESKDRKIVRGKRDQKGTRRQEVITNWGKGKTRMDEN